MSLIIFFLSWIKLWFFVAVKNTFIPIFAKSIDNSRPKPPVEPVIKQFFPSVISLGGKKLAVKFYLDTMSNRFEIGGKYVTINISKKHYNSLKKLTEKIMVKKMRKKRKLGNWNILIHTGKKK